MKLLRLPVCTGFASKIFGVLLILPNSWGTTAVVFIETNRIVLAADGLAQSEDGPQSACKTLKTGEFFWTIAGTVPAGLDLIQIAGGTLGGSNGDRFERASRFGEQVLAGLRRTYERRDEDGTTVFEAIVTWIAPADGAAGGLLLGYVWDGNRVVLREPRRLMPISYASIGYHAIIDSYLDGGGAIPNPITAAFATSLVQMEIDGNGGHSGAPISAVVVNSPNQARYERRGNCR